MSDPVTWDEEEHQYPSEESSYRATPQPETYGEYAHSGGHKQLTAPQFGVLEVLVREAKQGVNFRGTPLRKLLAKVFIEEAAGKREVDRHKLTD